jgi:S1-C subfamily serine protease
MFMKEQQWSVGRTVGLLAIAAVVGGLSGASAALIVTPVSYGQPVAFNSATSTVQTATSTSKEPELVKLEPRLATPLVPPGFLSRRASPVATIYRKAKGATPEERSLTEDKMLGQAVALTSDGWFVTVADVIGQAHIADLTLWHDKKSYAIERAFTDSINRTAYIKVQARELTTPAFGQTVDVVRGSEMWLEPRQNSLAPSLVLSLIENIPSTESVSSEVSSRRIVLNGKSEIGDLGSPAWSSGGALVGLVESKKGESIRIVPASSISSSFATLLNESTIRHAYLGVRAVDVSAWKIDGDRGTLPLRGAILRDDKKSGKLAIAKDSPAAVAGLKTGDVILNVERDILDGTRDLGEILSEYRPDTKVTLHINRKGEEMDISVTLGSVVTSEPVK